MREFILTALKAKFTGVNANILGRVADMLAKTATTEEEATTAVAGVTKDYINLIEAQKVFCFELEKFPFILSSVDNTPTTASGQLSCF